MNPPGTLATLNFETIPDFEVLPFLTGERPEGWEGLVDSFSRYLGPEKSDFPPLPLHQILIPTLLIANIVRSEQFETSYQVTHLYSQYGAPEAGMLSAMVGWLSDARPRLLSYAGRSFELPLLKMRCMRHSVKYGVYWLVGDKYDNYDHRYASHWNVDMMDVLSGHGASRPSKLREVAAMCRLPVSGLPNGKEILPTYLKGDLLKIRNFSELKALTTFLIYAHWQRLKCVIPDTGFEETVKSVIAFILTHGSDRPHLADYLREWRDLDPQVDALFKVTEVIPF